MSICRVITKQKTQRLVSIKIPDAFFYTQDTQISTTDDTSHTHSIESQFFPQGLHVKSDHESLI